MAHFVGQRHGAMGFAHHNHIGAAGKVGITIDLRFVGHLIHVVHVDVVRHIKLGEHFVLLIEPGVGIDFPVEAVPVVVWDVGGAAHLKAQVDGCEEFIEGIPALLEAGCIVIVSFKRLGYNVDVH